MQDTHEAESKVFWCKQTKD